MPTGTELLKNQRKKLVAEMRSFVNKTSMSSNSKKDTIEILDRLDEAVEASYEDSISDIMAEIENKRNEALKRYQAAKEPVKNDAVDMIDSTYSNEIRDDVQLFDFYSHLKDEMNNFSVLDLNFVADHDSALYDMNTYMEKYEKALDDFNKKFDNAKNNLSNEFTKITGEKELTKDNMYSILDKMHAKFYDLRNFANKYNEIQRTEGKDENYHIKMNIINREEANALAQFDIDTKSMQAKYNIDDNMLMTPEAINKQVEQTKKGNDAKEMSITKTLTEYSEIAKSKGLDRDEYKNAKTTEEKKAIKDRHKSELDNARKISDEADNAYGKAKKEQDELKSQISKIQDRIATANKSILKDMTEKIAVEKSINAERAALLADKEPTVGLTDEEKKLRKEYHDAKKIVANEYFGHENSIKGKTGLFKRGSSVSENLSKKSDEIIAELNAIDTKSVDKNATRLFNNFKEAAQNLSEDKGKIEHARRVSEMQFIASNYKAGKFNRFIDKNPNLKNKLDEFSNIYDQCNYKAKDGSIRNHINDGAEQINHFNNVTNRIDVHFKDRQEKFLKDINTAIDAKKKTITDMNIERNNIQKKLDSKSSEVEQLDAKKKTAMDEWRVYNAIHMSDEMAEHIDVHVNKLLEQAEKYDEKNAKTYAQMRAEERDALKKQFDGKRAEVEEERTKFVDFIKSSYEKDKKLYDTLNNDLKYLEAATKADNDLHYAEKFKNEAVERYKNSASYLKDGFESYSKTAQETISNKEDSFINVIHEKRTIFSSKEYKAMDDALQAYMTGKANKAANIDKLYEDAKNSLQTYVDLRNTETGMKKTTNGQKRLDSAKSILALFENKEHIKEEAEKNINLIDKDMDAAGKIKENIAKDLTGNDRKTKVNNGPVKSNDLSKNP